VRLKVHEDYAGYPSIIDEALTVADQYDVQIAMHTDGINESCELHETVAAIGGRSIHAYHVEGIGGGHAPDILAIAGVDNVIGSSTTPTIPYGRNVVAEHHAMMWSVHGMNPRVASDRAMIADRIRDATMRAESVLHDVGAISIINSDSQGMGRIGESIRRTWQLAHQMKLVHGERATHDNGASCVTSQSTRSTRRVPRHRSLGRVPRARQDRDIVLWRPEFFGVKPELVIQGRIRGVGCARRGQRVDSAERTSALRATLGRARPGGGERQREFRVGGGGTRLPSSRAQSASAAGRRRHPSRRQAPHALQPGQSADRDRPAQHRDPYRWGALASPAGR